MGCVPETPVHISTLTAPTASPIPQRATQYPSTFGINYNHPEQYLSQGEQTRLSNPSVFQSLRRNQQSISHLGEIYAWIKREFASWEGGGQTIGKLTADQLFTERRLGGCHDWALVFTAMVRELGYPAVMVDTASLPWVRQFQSGQKGPYTGHVFVEVWVEREWLLVDSTNNWVVTQGYDPANPVIPLKSNATGSNSEIFGFIALRKGTDTWGYGIRSAAELNRLMEEHARRLKLDTLHFPDYHFQRLKLPSP